MPRTRGDGGIPADSYTGWLEKEEELLTLPAREADAFARAIARHVAPLIRDGDTVQTGLGKIPDAVADSLSGRRYLKVHTGLLGDGLMRLIRSSAVDHAVVGNPMGTAALHKTLDHPALEFRPVSFTHDPRRLAATERLMSAMAGSTSRIEPPSQGPGPVYLSRFDTDVVSSSTGRPTCVE